MSGLVLLFCLLIGSISCVPTKKQAGDQDSGWPLWYRGSGGGTDLGGGSSSGSGGLAPGVGSAIYGNQGGAGDTYGGDMNVGSQMQYPGGQQGVQQDIIVGQPDEGYFWTDVTDLEPLYAFDSRSRYQRGRVVFAQTRYTPTEYGYPDFYPEGPSKGGPKM